jgi:WD40 repeat protein
LLKKITVLSRAVFFMLIKNNLYKKGKNMCTPIYLYFFFIALVMNHMFFAMELSNMAKNKQQDIVCTDNALVQKKITDFAKFNVICSDTHEPLLPELQLHISSHMMHDFLVSTDKQIRESMRLGDDSHGKLLFAEISNNGKWLATVDDAQDNVVYIWDMANAQLKHVLSGYGYNEYFDSYEIITTNSVHYNEDAVSHLLISPHDKYVITSSEDTEVKVWDLATGCLEHVLPVYNGHIRLMAVSHDNKYLAMVLNDNRRHDVVQIWDIQSGDSVNLFDHIDDHCISSLVFNYTSDQVVMASCKPALYVGDIETGQIVHKRVEQEAKYICGDTLVTPENYVVTGRGRQVKLWNIKTEQEYLLKTYDTWFKSLFLTLDASRLIVIVSDGRLEVWDLKGELLQQFDFGSVQSMATLVACDGYGKKFLKTLTQANNSVGVYDIENNTLEYELYGHADAISILKISNNGTHVVTGASNKTGKDKVAKIWSLQKSPARLWLEREVLPLQANLIGRAYLANQLKQNFVITSNTDDMFIWMSFPKYVHEYLCLYLDINLITQPEQKHL